MLGVALGKDRAILCIHRLSNHKGRTVHQDKTQMIGPKRIISRTVYHQG